MTTPSAAPAALSVNQFQTMPACNAAPSPHALLRLQYSGAPSPRQTRQSLYPDRQKRGDNLFQYCWASADGSSPSPLSSSLPDQTTPAAAHTQRQSTPALAPQSTLKSPP